MKFARNKTNGYFLLAFVIGSFSLLMYLPSDYFDTGQSLCLSVLLAHTECYACGMTRAFQHIIHFEFQTAWEFNKLAFIAFPMLSGLLAFEIYKCFKAG